MARAYLEIDIRHQNWQGALLMCSGEDLQLDSFRGRSGHSWIVSAVGGAYPHLSIL